MEKLGKRFDLLNNRNPKVAHLPTRVLPKDGAKGI